jgi:hypothetical protein
MKPTIILAALVASTTFAAAQGSLTPPPGAPAPVMKSLDQIEARTPLVAGQPGVTVDGVTGAITITARGSYYLTGNLTTTGTASCIDVGSHSATIDLNGFTISRTTGTESGSAGVFVIGVAGQKVMIRNGHIIGGGTTAGFARAILSNSSTDGGVDVENVHCFNVRDGIILGVQSINTVRNSSVELSGGEGIRADVVTSCVVRNTVSHGIYGNTISGCTVRQSNSTFGNGIVDGATGFSFGTVSNCWVSVADGIGIRVRTVIGCYAQTDTGAFAITASLVNSSTALRINNADVAISATTAVGCHIIGGTAIITNKYNMP